MYFVQLYAVFLNMLLNNHTRGMQHIFVLWPFIAIYVKTQQVLSIELSKFWELHHDVRKWEIIVVLKSIVVWLQWVALPTNNYFCGNILLQYLTFIILIHPKKISIAYLPFRTLNSRTQSHNTSYFNQWIYSLINMIPSPKLEWSRKKPDSLSICCTCLWFWVCPLAVYFVGITLTQLAAIRHSSWLLQVWCRHSICCPW